MSDNRIIITDCSGFVGRNIATELVRQGRHVIGFGPTNPNIAGVEYKEFDITDDNSFLTEEYRESTIVNTSALTSQSEQATACEKTNYLAVLNLLALNPKGKFIHISSSSIYNLKRASFYVSECSFSSDAYSFYSASSFYRAKAEQALLSGVVKRDVAPISLRPHAIYGQGDATLLPALLDRVKNNHLTLPKAGKVRHSLTHVTNLVNAVLCGLEYNSSKPEAFNITDAHPIILAEAITAAMGEGIKLRGVPRNLVTSKLGQLAHILPYEARQIGFERTYDISKALYLLNYKPTEFHIE